MSLPTSLINPANLEAVRDVIDTNIATYDLNLITDPKKAKNAVPNIIIGDNANVRQDIIDIKNGKPIPIKSDKIISPEKLETAKVTKGILDVKDKVVNKISAFGKYFRDAPIFKNGTQGILQKMSKNKKGIFIGAAVIATAFAVSKAATGGHRGRNRLGVGPQTNRFANRSAYMPTSYARGFDDIKKLSTDFGSKVHLDKTTTKVMVSPRNSTRSGYVTSTKSITNKNIALNLHANAINHTRY